MPGYYDEYNMSYPSTGADGYPSMFAYGNQVGGMQFPQAQTAQYGDPGAFSQYLSTMSKTAPNPYMQIISSFGAPILSALGGLFGGESWQEKQAKKVSGLAMNRLGQNILDPQQYLADYMRSTAGIRNRQAEQVNRRLGLDSGIAQGEMMSQMQGPIANFMLNTSVLNKQLMSQRDTQLLQLMAQLAG